MLIWWINIIFLLTFTVNVFYSNCGAIIGLFELMFLFHSCLNLNKAINKLINEQWNLVTIEEWSGNRAVWHIIWQSQVIFVQSQNKFLNLNQSDWLTAEKLTPVNVANKNCIWHFDRFKTILSIFSLSLFQPSNKLLILLVIRIIS